MSRLSGAGVVKLCEPNPFTVKLKLRPLTPSKNPHPPLVKIIQAPQNSFTHLSHFPCFFSSPLFIFSVRQSCPNLNNINNMELLADELGESSRETRKTAARRIAAVGRTIGPDAVKEELIPFLVGKIDDDDEILLIVSEQLGECAAEVFNNGEGAVCLLEPLEQLAAVEETVVRDAAVEATCKVVDSLPDSAAQGPPTEMVLRLATGDWFTKKVSACGMVASAYGRATAEGKQELLDMYVTNLCVDDAPMVRRAAAKQLGAVASKVGANQVLAKIMPAYEKLCVKDTDSVRILAMSQTSTLAGLLEDDNSRKETLLRIIDDCHKDRSWRVRCALAADLGKIAVASGAAFTTDALCAIAIVLIGDPEPEVREIAFKQLATICSVVGGPVFLEKILPEINSTRFGEEEEIKVQTAFAQAIMDLIPMLGKSSGSGKSDSGGGDGNSNNSDTDLFLKNQLVPLITHALTRQLDEESEGFQHMMQAMINMKLKVFQNMDDLMSVLSPAGAQSFTDDVLLSVVGNCSVSEHYEDSKYVVVVGCFVVLTGFSFIFVPDPNFLVFLFFNFFFLQIFQWWFSSIVRQRTIQLASTSKYRKHCS